MPDDAPADEPRGSVDALPLPTDPVPQSDRKGWRAHLPKVPDPVQVDLPGQRPQATFTRWFALAVAILVAGIALNWYLTDGGWVLPEQRLYDADNPFGDTEVQFLTTHPYDVLTATLFVGSTLILGLSLLPRPKDGTAGLLALVDGHRHKIRAVGWLVFAFHWAATGMNFYHIEEGDLVNAAFAFASVFVLTYFAYQERISEHLGADNASLRFAAGSVFIAATVWYAFLRIEFLSQWIIEVVAGHTVAFLEMLGQDVRLSRDGRTGFLSAITYLDQPIPIRTVIIILACTAIQSMMIFVAAALAVAKADWRRRLTVIAVTVPIVYVLNLVRNVLIIFLWETRWLEQRLGISSSEAFGIAHNWVGKVGSLIALVFIALFMFRVLPEVVAAVVGLLDLPRRRGPVEQYLVSLPPGTIQFTLGLTLAVTGAALLFVPNVDQWVAFATLIAGGFAVVLGNQRRRAAMPTPEADVGP